MQAADKAVEGLDQPALGRDLTEEEPNFEISLVVEVCRNGDRKKVVLELSEDEAIVIFAWVSRINSSEQGTFSDQAEQRVLWDIESLLESKLVQPFSSNYDELLASARARVRDPED